MKLTAERSNGIKTGYWSQEKKDALIQKLGKIEHKGPDLLGDICKGICLHTPEKDMNLDEVCQGCPTYKMLCIIDSDRAFRGRK